jgi:hypothetical protein
MTIRATESRHAGAATAPPERTLAQIFGPDESVNVQLKQNS